MIIREEVYLAHYGVKGQRWGVRRARTPQQQAKRKRNLKIAGAAAGVGIGVAGAVLLNKHRTRLKATMYVVGMGKNAGQRHIAKHGSRKIAAVSPELQERAYAARKAAGSGEQHQALMKQVARDHLKSVTSVNSQLKDWFNQGNVRIPDRKYIDTGFWEKAAGTSASRLSETTFKG